MQGAGFDDLVQLPAQAHELFVNGTTVRFNLRLAGATDKAQTTTLTFKVGPGADQPRTLIVQCCHLDLQDTLAGRSTVAENLEDETGAIQQFDVPRLFKVALLHRCDGSVDQNKVNFSLFKDGLELLDFTGAEQHARAHGAQGHDIRPFDIQMRQGMRQCDGFGQGGLCNAAVIV